MILICNVAVIAGIFFTHAQAEGTLISENENNYYVDFTEDFKKNNWKSPISKTNLLLVDKKDCIKKPK